MFPGPRKDARGGLAGRRWEAVVEQQVLDMDKRWMEDARWSLLQAKLSSHAARLRGEKEACAGLLGDARNLHSKVAMAMGARHWTTVRSHQIVTEMVNMLR